MQQRQFTSGSRQAPDPYDQFLEEHQYYRKHTARDASCLFRVISEQMYDTQLHHLAIREKCVNYMRKHRKFFQNLVDRDFDEYLDDMSKPKTYGTLLELQAAGYLFERNVILFEPFDLGKYFNEHRSYFKEVFRVFYTPERHFDSVFTSEYIQEAAICQSIVYEILYKDLFKLPDVAFAVEQMLHGPNFENMEYTTKTNEDGYATRLYLSDGREFELDLPHNTDCILENYKLCHFHYTNFPRFSDDLQRELKGAHHEDNEKNTLLIQRTAESFLPNKYMSCVRQLLQENITPFPYKVAKALDPNMYRNIEFDSWNEMRKEMKLQNWYNGDSNFKVGAKCHVKLRKSEQDLYTCHIQEIAVDKGQCIVFIEQLGEKRLVPYENLTPLPPDQFKPWTVPYRFQRQMQKFSSVRFTRQYNYRFKFNSTTEHHHHQFHQQFCGGGSGGGMDNDSCSNSDYINENDAKRSYQHHHHHHNQCSAAAAASYYKLKQYTHLENFRTQTVEFCTMPLTVEHNNGTAGSRDGCGESDGKGNNNGSGQRSGDLNDNSRAGSRANSNAGGGGSQSGLEGGTTAKGGESSSGAFVASNEENMLGGIPGVSYALQHGEGIYELEHYNPNGAATAVYVPELQAYYPMYPYPPAGGVLPEEYYGYCTYDGAMAPAPTFMSAVNGCYYVCSNGPPPPTGAFMNSSAAASNQFLATAPQPIGIPAPPQNAIAMYAQAPPPPYAAATNQCPSIQVTNAGTAAGGLNNNTANQQHYTPSPRLSRASNNSMSNTPLSGRINYDARKSYKASGVDLPTDTATLRFFYNLGLDYYHQKQAKANENSEQAKTSEVSGSNDDADSMTADFQNIRLDENANQVPTPNTVKSDANNNTLMPEVGGGGGAGGVGAGPNNVNDKPPVSQYNNKTSNTTTLGSNTLSNAGNKTNHRRYSSRYFNNKDRPMQQHQPPHHHYQQQHTNAARNHMNSNSNVHVGGSSYSNHSQQQQHLQHHPNQASRNNHKNMGNGGGSAAGGGGAYLTSTTPNSSRSGQNQPGGGLLPHPQSGHLQPPPQSHVVMSEHSVQTSPMCGYDEAFMVNDTHNCNTPTSNNSNVNTLVNYGPYGGGGGAGNEQMNEAGMCNGPYGVSLATTPGGVFVPMQMTTGAGPPPPPYGMYPSHAPPPPPPGYAAATTGIPPNYINGPLHLAPPPPAIPPGAANSTTSSSDTTENNAAAASMEIINSNNGLTPLPCPSYPPPPLPYYYASGGGVPSGPPMGNMIGNGNAGGNGGSGVHLITQMAAPPTPTNHGMTPSFSTPHPAMGPQGYYCLPPPPQQMPPPQTPQQMQQPSPMINNAAARSDVPTSNND
ncbi:ovarian tumor isoform X2 [Musca autumnalis]|uniref:ovarian tumor isoform X2 n=1 Tax=Musca autumnalis TaxID=221902 RepID=UPI003CEAE139